MKKQVYDKILLNIKLQRIDLDKRYIIKLYSFILLRYLKKTLRKQCFV